MKHTLIRRSGVACLGAAAAALVAGGPAALADDIDQYGGADVNSLTIFNGTTFETFTTTTNYFETVDETTGAVTPHFSFPTLVETTGTLPGGEQAFGSTFLDSMSQFFGDSSNFPTTSSSFFDLVDPVAGEHFVFDPLSISDLTPIPIVDMDPIPF
ncbi:MAG: hypothetical protein WB785_02745 [Mycobacterium sp.]|uniref:hypothetical protein n=1 Tax=Mycobacterium sp. TaxID=1785 RepID=UPI003C4D05EF